MHYRKLISIVISRKLSSNEVVHHCDGHHQNNKIDNLYVFDGKGKHLKHHIEMGTIAMGLARCYTDEYILKYVKKRILPAIKKSNVAELMEK